MPTRHDAFISYSHAADGPLATALESGLEKLAKPLLKLRALDVFRDQTSLTAAPALWPGIVAHLEASEWFLLLASPQSALSMWCNKEVQWWLDNRSPDRMLVLLTDGGIAWDRGTQDFDWPRTSSLPRLLERRCADEPLYVDFRWARGSELLTLRNAKFRDAMVNIAAPIRGVAKDELDGADLRQLRAQPPARARWSRGYHRRCRHRRVAGHRRQPAARGGRTPTRHRRVTATRGTG